MTSAQSKKNVLLLNCSSGISGDMMVAALLDLGADQDYLLRTLESLPLEGYRIAVSRVKKSGIDACDFDVILDAEHENHDHDMAYLHPDRFSAKLSSPVIRETSHEDDGHDHDYDHHEYHNHDHNHHEHDDHDHDDHNHHNHEHDHHEHDDHDHDDHNHHNHEHDHHEQHDHVHDDHNQHDYDHHDHDHHDHDHHDHDHHDHGHHHHGRNLDDIMRILEAGSLTPHALELAKKIFRILALAESKAHGLPLDKVHFHEVGAVDSIVDIASAAICIDQLGISDCIFTDLTEGSGTVRCQHGILPIPVPATAGILSDNRIPFHIAPQILGELITPTGAALVAALRTDISLPESYVISKIGLGAGKRDYNTAGILRAMLIESSADSLHDKVMVMQTNLDDCSPEALGYAMECLMKEGALDAFYTPIYMKKNRPAYMLTVLAAKEDRIKMEKIIFRHTTSIGIRVTYTERTILERESRSLTTPWGPADVKYCRFENEVYCYPEHESVSRIATEHGCSYEQTWHRIRSFAESNR